MNAEAIFPCCEYNPWKNFQKAGFALEIEGLNNESFEISLSSYLHFWVSRFLESNNLRKIDIPRFIPGDKGGYSGYFEDNEGGIHLSLTFLPNQMQKTQHLVVSLTVMKYYLVEKGFFCSFPFFSKNRVVKDLKINLALKDAIQQFDPILVEMFIDISRQLEIAQKAKERKGSKVARK